ncbi:hypothetical protein K2X89_09120 [Myxococcota bacterium]|nr:hypothetical protein [Myxococcota bacterium]
MSSLKMLGRLTAVLILLSGLATAGAAMATPITMSPNPATVNAFIGKDFSLRLDAGDSVTRTLDFTVSGSGGCGFLCPSTAVAMIVFDGATVLSARDTDSGLLSAGNVVRGFVTSKGAVAGLLIDIGAPSSESFRLTLSSVPTTATLYALNLASLKSFDLTRVLRSSVSESTRLTFSVAGGSHAVPEPSAALVFGGGILAAALGIRRPS